jgi:hypothetical protein
MCHQGAGLTQLPGGYHSSGGGTKGNSSTVNRPGHDIFRRMGALLEGGRQGGMRIRLGFDGRVKLTTTASRAEPQGVERPPISGKHS